MLAPAAPPVDENDENPHRRRAIADVKAHRKTPGVSTKKQKEETTIYTNRFDLWKENSTNFHLLPALARPLFTIPATQAQSERMLSSAGEIITKTLNRMDPNNLNLASLKHS